MTKLIETINIILIVVATFLFTSFVANMIGRAWVYSQQTQDAQINLCLSKGFTYPQCWHGIVSGYANFENDKIK